MWYSDDDDIAPNAHAEDRCRTGELGRIWQIVLPNYLPHRIPNIVIGTEKDDEPTRSLDDILAIPDLACGAWCKVLSMVSGVEFGNAAPSFSTALSKISSAALGVLLWFAESHRRLARLLGVIDPPHANGLVNHVCSAPFALDNFRESLREEMIRRSAG